MEQNPLTSLYRVVQNRRANPAEGSYTCYLFSQGLDKILKKCGEECAETIIAAKNDAAHLALAAQLQDHSLYREYEAVCAGSLREDAGTVDAPIGRHPVDRKKMAVDRKNGREAVTHWSVLARYALAAGIGTLCLILAVSGVVEWYAGHVNGQIVIAVFIELFLGIAFLLSNSVGKKHATGKPGRVKDK